MQFDIFFKRGPNFMTTAVAVLISIILIIFNWYRGSKFREIALNAAKGLCERSNVELLDDKISLFKVKLCRDFDNKLKFLRAYTFEYTTPNMNDRSIGFIALMGPAVILRRLEISSFDAVMHSWLKEESFKRKHKIKFLFSFGSIKGIKRKIANSDNSNNIVSRTSKENTNTENLKHSNLRKPSNDSNIINFQEKKEKIKNKK